MHEIDLEDSKSKTEKPQSQNNSDQFKSKLKSIDLKDSRVARLFSQFPEELDPKKLIFSSAANQRRKILISVFFKEVLTVVTVFLI